MSVPPVLARLSSCKLLQPVQPGVWSFTGIPAPAETMLLSQCCCPAVMPDSKESPLSQLEWKWRIVFLYIDIIDAYKSLGGKKGQKNEVKIYLVHYYYYEPFFLDWGQDAALWLQERLIKGSMGNDCFQKLHGKLAMLILLIAWERLCISYSYIGDVFCALIHWSENWRLALIFFLKVFSAPLTKLFLQT